MPTGYTADVQSGKVTAFPEFAMQCARAFGALIHMREEPSGAPIPAELKPHTSYHDDKIAEARQTLAEVAAMDADACDAKAAEEYEAELKSRLKYDSGKREAKARYNAMLVEVARWTPPTGDHVGLKEFMEQQLHESIRFDCSDYHRDPPERLTGERWRETTLAKAACDLAYHEDERAKEIERTASRNAWIKALRGSLP